jgi:hypothetical protein
MALICFALLRFALLCIDLHCFNLLCFALLCIGWIRFDWNCFALLCYDAPQAAPGQNQSTRLPCQCCITEREVKA